MLTYILDMDSIRTKHLLTDLSPNFKMAPEATRLNNDFIYNPRKSLVALIIWFFQYFIILLITRCLTVCRLFKDYPSVPCYKFLMKRYNFNDFYNFFLTENRNFIIIPYGIKLDSSSCLAVLHWYRKSFISVRVISLFRDTLCLKRSK